MANTKLLKIRVQYIPNCTFGKTPDGKKIKDEGVKFYFQSDPQTTAIVHGQLGMKYSADGDCITRDVKYSQYKDFLYGKKAMPKILSLFEQQGYVFDTNELQNTEISVEQEKDKFANSGISKKVHDVTGSFIDSIIESMRNNLKDPNFLNLIQSVGAIRKAVGADDVDRMTTLSPKNTIMILSQWVSAGRQGAPKYVATKKQWSEIFDRTVKQDALPLYYTRPFDTKQRSKSKTMSDVGVSSQDYASNPLLQKNIDMLSHDSQYGLNVNSEFNITNPYYDVSDTELMAGSNKNNIDFDNKHVFNDTANTNTDSASTANINANPAAAASGLENKIIETLTKYAEKHKLGDLGTVIRGGKPNVYDSGNKFINIIIELAYQQPSINRIAVTVDSWGQINQKQQATKVGLTLALAGLVLTKYGLYEDYAKKLMGQGINELEQKGAGSLKKSLSSLVSNLSDIIYIIDGITESYTPDLFRWVLNTLGISMEEYMAMPDSDEEANARMAEVRNKFVNIFNNMINEERKRNGFI